jgi:carboxylesterase type B
MAIEWIQDNVAGFGGDRNRITLFGQSAGAASVDYYTYAWTSDPIASSFIPESGTAIGIGPQTAAQSAASWYNVTAKLGCGNATSNAATVLACMRTKNYTSILSSLSSSGLTGNVGFGPTIDETVVFSDYLNRSAAGNFIKRPLLIGNTDYEAGLFRAVAALDGVSSQFSDAYWEYFNLNGFVCPAGARANVSVANGVPTWRYRWFGEFPNTIITTVPDSGAWHASELPILFNNRPVGPDLPANTTAEAAIGSYFRGAWAAFAKDPVNGLKSYSGGNGTGWPTYNPGGDTLVRLAFANQTGPNLAIGNMYDGLCNSTFTVPASALVTASSTTTGSATGTASSSATGSATPSTVSKSEGRRSDATVGFVVMMAAVVFAL